MRYAVFIVMTFVWVALLLPISSVQSNDSDEIRIRLAHFSPDAGTVNVYINDELVLTQLQFGTLSDWFAFPTTGDLNIRVSSTADNAVQFQLDSIVSNSSHSWSTVALIGLSATESLALQSLNEDRGEILPGEGRFAFFHAVQGVGSLDILLNDTLLFQLVGYPDVNSTQEDNDGFVYVDVVSSDYELIIQNTLSGAFIVDPFELSLLPDRSYFLALVGTAENPELIVTSDPLSGGQVVAETPTPVSNEQNAHIRLGHFSSGTGDLDFYIDGERLNSSPLSFTTVGSFMELNPGEHTFEVRASNQPHSPSLLPESSIVVSAGSWTTIVAIGLTDNDTLAIQILDEDFSSLAEGDVRLTIFHAVPGIGALDVIVNDVPLVSLLGYPGSQGDNDGLATRNLLAGMYSIRVVNSANEDEVFIDLGEINLAEGNHFLLALIRANPPFVFTYVPVE